MKIEKLEITKAGPLEDLVLQFYKPELNYFGNLDISVIVGENGVGKTTILKLIAYAFFPNLYKTMYRREYPIYSLDYSIGKENFTVVGGEIKKNKKIPSKIIVSSFAVYEQFSTGQRSQENKEERDSVYCYCGPMSKSGMIKGREVKQIIIDAFYRYETKNINHHSLKELMNIIGYEGVPYIEITRKRTFMSSGFRYTAEDLKDEFNDFYKYLKLNTFRAEETRLLDPNLITDELLDRIQEYEKKGFVVIGDLFFYKCDKLVPFSKMSSGEITMFYRYFPLIQLVTDNCLIIIDEPETHLHPRWIREYIYNLYRIFKKFKAQIIIASHSPIIAADVPKECIIGLGKIGSKVQQYNVKERTLAGDPVSILQDVFHLNDYKGEFSKNKINDVMKLIKKNKLDEALQIYNDLGTTSDKYSLFKEIAKYLPDNLEE
jgi:predicted ATPase